MTEKEDLYYLQDTRSTVGNSMLFWRVRGEGYTTDVREAATYTKEQAFKQHATRATDRPWRKDYIDARIKPHIDVQTCNYGEHGSI